MARSKREPKSRLERAHLVAGLVLALMGIAIGVLGLPGKVEDALGMSGSSKTAALELEQKRAELAAAGPRLDVSYLFLTTDLVSAADQESEKKHAASKRAVTLLSFPSIRNELLDDDQQGAESSGCGRLGKYPQNSVVFLVIQNRGMRDASSISVHAERLRLKGKVRIDESVDGGNDYVAKCVLEP
jgi:hypothetical protein